MYSNVKLKQFSLCTSFSNLFQLKSKRSLILGEVNSSPSIHHSRHLPSFTRFVMSAIFDVFQSLLQFSQRTCSRSCPCNDPDSLRWQRISSAGPRTSNNPATQFSTHCFFGTASFNLILALAGKPNWRGTGDLAPSKAEVKYYHMYQCTLL